MLQALGAASEGANVIFVSYTREHLNQARRMALDCTRPLTSVYFVIPSNTLKFRKSGTIRFVLNGYEEDSIKGIMNIKIIKDIN